MFLGELIDLLELPRPEPAGATHENNDYVFERAVRRQDMDGGSRLGRIDLYRRDSFVLEAKQSRWKDQPKEVKMPPEQAGLPGFEARETLGRRNAQRGWDVLMRNAREQAEQYARALPTDHGWPPFIIVCDVGHCLELYADFTGQGKNYRQFPDRTNFRIFLDDLRDPEVRERLRAIWLDPHSLDPSRKAARVTRVIAGRLARVSRSLERRGHHPEKVAHFLMRCLFTMFSEDVGLLPSNSFTEMLQAALENPESFAAILLNLWCSMDKGGVAAVLRKRVRRFNGSLFADATVIPLEREEIGELLSAARQDWRFVEPAIFGTLLEQALDPAERRALGAHYTPRAYVERLVIATVIEPLRQEWEGPVLATIESVRAEDPRAAIRLAHEFHVRLVETRVLDPACGTGNFLYVALELMKQLEGEVLETLAALGGQEALALETMSVDPRNFLGLEINPRAAAIAELVLWLGYLQWHLRNGGDISDPVLQSFGNIQVMDAVLRHDGERPNADRTATELANPRPADWPAADFIVGNPPFIGGATLRSRLGDAYAMALWQAHPQVNRSADFVMQWWDKAADLLTRTGTRLRRFGFVTTNSITQEFSRRVIAQRLNGRNPIHLVMAIPDHPWTRATHDTAAVRIAMTVAAAGEGEGVVRPVLRAAALHTDQPEVTLGARPGRINADLTVGVDVTRLVPLRAHDELCSRGVALHGAGFIVTPAEAVALGLGWRDGLERHIRPYRHGRDLMAHPRGVMVIDLFGLSEVEVRQRFPEVYGHLLRRVKPERDRNREEYRRLNWWLFGRRNLELRGFLTNLSRYIATVETAKHRVFQFLDINILPDNKLVCFGLEDGHSLGVLHSRIHYAWYLARAGMIGVYEQPAVYIKTVAFDPFPFPDASPAQRAVIGALAEELDATRKAVLAEHGNLTLTGLYNLRDKLRAGAVFTVAEQDLRVRGRVDLIDELHRQIDGAVAEAYGWPVDLLDEEIVARLVALNAERAAEERAGRVRWLRPDYQLARAGIELLGARGQADEAAQGALALPVAPTRKPRFPRDLVGQTAAVLAALRIGQPVQPGDIANGFDQGRRAQARIDATLQALVRLGHVSHETEGYCLRRVA
jgi:SAM-dependent methyltransferase